MGVTTAIAWTDHTFNPWWGCERVSPGCQHCYAESFAKRTGNDVWGKGNERRFFGDKHWNEPLKWDRDASNLLGPALVFCASMADVFEDRADLIEHRARLFELMASTPHLIWQVLTKRPQNVLRMVPRRWLVESDNLICERCGSSASLAMGVSCAEHEPRPTTGWPANVWIGTTVEDQKRADERIPDLASIPAPVRFLSCEPLLGYVDLINHVGSIDWVICGGESGPGHRPLDVDNARRLRQQCQMWDVPFFFKQVGGRTPTAGGDELDGEHIKQFPASAMRGAA